MQSISPSNTVRRATLKYVVCDVLQYVFFCANLQCVVYVAPQSCLCGVAGSQDPRGDPSRGEVTEQAARGPGQEREQVCHPENINPTIISDCLSRNV